MNMPMTLNEKREFEARLSSVERRLEIVEQEVRKEISVDRYSDLLLSNGHMKETKHE